MLSYFSLNSIYLFMSVIFINIIITSNTSTSAWQSAVHGRSREPPVYANEITQQPEVESELTTPMFGPLLSSRSTTRLSDRSSRSENDDEHYESSAEGSSLPIRECTEVEEQKEIDEDRRICLLLNLTACVMPVDLSTGSERRFGNLMASLPISSVRDSSCGTECTSVLRSGCIDNVATSRNDDENENEERELAQLALRLERHIASSKPAKDARGARQSRADALYSRARSLFERDDRWRAAEVCPARLGSPAPLASHPLNPLNRLRAHP